jgi:hypothetical protein
MDQQYSCLYRGTLNDWEDQPSRPKRKKRHRDPEWWALMLIAASSVLGLAVVALLDGGVLSTLVAG